MYLRSDLAFLSIKYDRVQLALKTCETKITSLTKDNAKLSDNIRNIYFRLSLMASRENDLKINNNSIVKQLSKLDLYRIMKTILYTRVRKFDENIRLRVIVMTLPGTKAR